MNKTAIKNFAISARKKLMAMAKDSAGIIGITAEEIVQPAETGTGFAVYPTHFGTQSTLTGSDLQKRVSLVRQIQEKGYESVMEEVAYTWFNRLIAVRFMEVNNYLPTGMRVLSSETVGKLEPDLVTLAPKVELGFTPAEVEEIYALKDDSRKSGKLFKLLFIKQCNALGEVLPKLFEKTADYTELLLDIAWDKEDGVVRELLGIDEADFLEAVEIIGWMYQYYNTEPKAAVFGRPSGAKIQKEEIPAATQLFTPDWIVRYMVENSLGRLWLEGHPNDTLKSDWKYYLDEAEQEAEVQAQLEEIRKEYKNLSPEEIKIIDPCMGSGHILVYAFDVLMQIYVSCGYLERDAAGLIVEKNLFGLDIDKRAYQLSYFAVMMKGRQYDRRFLSRKIPPNLAAIIDAEWIGGAYQYEMGNFLLSKEHQETLNYLLDAFKDSGEYGSLLSLEDRDYMGLGKAWEYTASQTAENINLTLWYDAVSKAVPQLIQQAVVLTQKYDVVVTNPPYMAVSNGNRKLNDYVKKNYPDSKADLFAVFVERCQRMTKFNGYTAMITQHSWMFLSSFEKLRAKLLHTDTVNMAHLGARAFEEIGGEVVQTTSWVQRHAHVADYKGTYARLVDYGSQQEKEKAFLAHGDLHTAQQENFSKIPGSPIAYWASLQVTSAFEDCRPLIEIAKPRVGLQTSNNERFIRLWYEVDYSKMRFHVLTASDTIECGGKWFPHNKGGEYRKWYGNNYTVVDYENDGFNIKTEKSENLRLGLIEKKNSQCWNSEFYFRECLTWSRISSDNFGVRFSPAGFVFDTAGTCIFSETQTLKYLLGFLITKVVNNILQMLNPTLTFQTGDISKLPIKIQHNNMVVAIVNQTITLSKIDWDSFETSWDFKRHPLVSYNKTSEAFATWQAECEDRFTQLKANEEELNRIFIDIYGLQDELTPEVADKDITVHRVYASKEEVPATMKGNSYVRTLHDEIVSLLSYAVGCMFGRYSIYRDGLFYAGGPGGDIGHLVERIQDHLNSQGLSRFPENEFYPDADNVLPITDDAYFSDDIVTRLCDFVKTVYGADTLEENLDFIAKALGNKGGSREVIRNYFLNDFYKDHCKTYQKRPIYWLFDSGKQNGFKALIYLHRYNEDTVGRVRADYLHKQQGFLENAIANCDYILQTSQNARDIADATKKKDKLVKQLAETRIYDQALAHIAHQRIPLDLDDGVKVNYEKFQGIEVKNEGTKAVKIDLLGKI